MYARRSVRACGDAARSDMSNSPSPGKPDAKPSKVSWQGELRVPSNRIYALGIGHSRSFVELTGRNSICDGSCRYDGDRTCSSNHVGASSWNRGDAYVAFMQWCLCGRKVGRGRRDAGNGVEIFGSNLWRHQQNFTKTLGRQVF